MEPSPNIPQEQSPTASRTLQVDFTWKGCKYLIFEKDDPEAKPIYIVDTRLFRPNLVFTSAVDGSQFGSGTLHPVSINADCEIRGQAVKLEALSRLKTKYTHQSRAFSKTDTPVPMTWTTTWDLKSWDFICLDPRQIPVARFSAKQFPVKKAGYLEFLGSEANNNEAAREEIVVTAFTLFNCMALRSTNMLNLFGAAIARPAKVGNIPAEETQESVKAQHDMPTDAMKGTEGDENAKLSTKV